MISVTDPPRSEGPDIVEKFCKRNLLDSGACDGFNIMFPWAPGGLDAFVD
jgi:hypothetical protein